MAKTAKTVFFCKECGYESSKWLGQCPGCREVGTFVEEPTGPKNKVLKRSLLNSEPVGINEVSAKDEERVTTGFSELDRVLGGGVVPGGLILVGGDPGIGKSTLLLQVCRNMSDNGKKILYISGEESLKQIKLRANRMGKFSDNLSLLSETSLDAIEAVILDKKPDIVIIDSIQTIFREDISSSVNVPVQMGGGIRTLENIQEVLDLGVYRVIIGTKAVENPDFIKAAIDRFGAEHIVVGVDAKDGLVAIEGWEKVSDKTALSLALAMKDIGVQTIVYTDISKDGMLAGPNVEQTKILSDKTGIDIIASGGMSCMDDLTHINDAGIHGAIIGKAIYEKRIDLKEAVNLFESGASYSKASAMPKADISFKDLKLDANGLIPVVVQDYVNGEVLMLAYMNEEAFNKTLETGIMTYYSRSRQELWVKGLTSGHFQYVGSLDIDCDNDTILAKVRQVGAACHTGNRTCFYRNIKTWNR